MQFKNYHKQLEVPFVIYADLEVIVEKIHGGILAVKNDPDISYTDANQKHKDCCYDDKYRNHCKCIEDLMWFISS